MLIDFSSMERSTLPSFLGGKGELRAKMVSDEKNRILHGILPPGSSIGCHTHETSSEIIYILSGSGRVKYDDTEEPLKLGDCHYCPKGHSHSLINDSDGLLEFFAVVPQQ